MYNYKIFVNIYIFSIQHLIIFQGKEYFFKTLLYDNFIEKYFEKQTKRKPFIIK